MKAQNKKLIPIYIIGTFIFLALLYFPLLINNRDEENYPIEFPTTTPSPTQKILITQIPSHTIQIMPVGTTGLSAAEQAYDLFMIEHHGKFTSYMDEIGSLFVQAGDDESLLRDDNWHSSVKQNLELMQSEAELIANYEAVPEKFSSVHQWMSQLEAETKLFSSIVINAIEDNELTKFEAERVITSTFNLFNIAVNAMTEREKVLEN